MYSVHTTVNCKIHFLLKCQLSRTIIFGISRKYNFSAFPFSFSKKRILITINKSNNTLINISNVVSCFKYKL